MIPAWLLAVRKFLGKLTDALEAGRKAGLWSVTDSIGVKPYKEIK